MIATPILLINITIILGTIPQSICFYKLYPHLGLEAKSGLIPVYNHYLLFEKLWSKESFWRYMTAVITGEILTFLNNLKLFADAGDLVTFGMVMIQYVIGLTALCYLAWLNEKLLEEIGMTEEEVRKKAYILTMLYAFALPYFTYRYVKQKKD